MRRTIAAIALACAAVACSKHEPVTFRRAQAFIEGDRKVAWTLHVTLVASGRPDADEVHAQMEQLGRTYRGQAHLERIVAEVITETAGETVVTASAPVVRDAKRPLGEVSVRWKD